MSAVCEAELRLEGARAAERKYNFPNKRVPKCNLGTREKGTLRPEEPFSSGGRCLRHNTFSLKLTCNAL